MVWSLSFYATFACKAKIGCRLRVKGPFGAGSRCIQRLLCAESHIKVNLAPSALAPPSTNLLSVWWGSWTGSPFRHRGDNPPNLSHFPSSPSPDRNLKVKGVKELSRTVHRWPPCLLRPCAQRPLVVVSCCLWNGSFILQNTENNLNDAVPNITAPKWCSSMKRKRKTEKKAIRR